MGSGLRRPGRVAGLGGAVVTGNKRHTYTLALRPTAHTPHAHVRVTYHPATLATSGCVDVWIGDATGGPCALGTWDRIDSAPHDAADIAALLQGLDYDGAVAYLDTWGVAS